MFGYFFYSDCVYYIYDVTYLSISNISCLFVLSYIKPKVDHRCNNPILLTTVLLLFHLKTAT